MRQVSRAKLAVVAFAVGSAALTVAAQASDGAKVRLCHGTASASNPYVLIEVSERALAGHFDGTAPGHGPKNNPDFVLAADRADCSGGPGGGGF
jgi:hypothetical protein